MRYTLRTIADITGGELFGEDATVTSIATDSRSAIADGALFVALAGAGRDGHDFIAATAKGGARAFLVDRRPSDCIAGSFVVVSNTLTALQALAAHHRGEFKGEVVAITGSNGKTIVKEWFAQLWPSCAGKMYRSPRSYNSQLGVALALLGLEGDERVAVIEAGISLMGEMERLEAMIRPTVGVITNIGEAHGENFASKEAKLDEKLKLFVGSKIVIRGDLMEQTTIEEHNLLLAHAIYDLIGVNPLGDENIEPVALRLEMQQGVMGSSIINDSYNNDLTSLRVALDFQRRNAGAIVRTLILSDIEQSALPAAELYGKVAEIVERYAINQFVGVGSMLKAYSHLFRGMGAQFFGSTEEFLRSLDPGDFAKSSVLVKGGRSFRLERVARRLEDRTHTTTLEVNLSRLTENFNHYRAMVAPGVRTMAMVKASGYGAGGVQVARALQSAGASYLAVAFADEGVALRRGGITMPIVVLNSDPGSFALMTELGLEPEIYSIEALTSYSREVRRAGISVAPIHIKLDTGMHRLGFQPDDLDELVSALRAENHVRVASVFSHFAASEDSCEDDFTREQISRFRAMSSRLVSQLKLSDCIMSICNSAGVERFAEAHFDMVRLGICLYKNVSTLKTRITQVKTVAAGETIGYNRRTRAERQMRIGIIPIGYADGMDRGLGCRVGSVAVHGVLCDIVGNVCMDTTIIDVTDLDGAMAGDVAVIFAPEGNEWNAHTPEQIASSLATIDYEILTSVAPRIKHLYIND